MVLCRVRYVVCRGIVCCANGEGKIAFGSKIENRARSEYPDQPRLRTAQPGSKSKTSHESTLAGWSGSIQMTRALISWRSRDALFNRFPFLFLKYMKTFHNIFRSNFTRTPCIKVTSFTSTIIGLRERKNINMTSAKSITLAQFQDALRRYPAVIKTFSDAGKFSFNFVLIILGISMASSAAVFSRYQIFH